MSSAASTGAGQVVWLAQRQARPGFSARDQLDLELWASDDRRMAIWEGEVGSFAMLYMDDAPWASWAVAREGGALRVWNTITLADVGEFSCMTDALAAVACAPSKEAEIASSVISLAAARLARGMGA